MESPRSSFWECGAVLTVVVLRLVWGPAGPAWADWVVVVGIWWALTSVASRTRLWPVATAGVMAYLLGIYLFRHLPGALGWWEHLH